MRIAKSAFETLASLLYPPHCAGCREPLSQNDLLCDACKKSPARIKPPFCRTCSQPFDGAIDGEFTCANCHNRHFHFECAVSVFRSRGVIRDLLHRFKYQQEFHLRLPLADWLMQSLHDARIENQPYDSFVPVPLHSARQREREYNQAEVLAAIASERTGRPMIRALKRIRYTPTQTRFDRAERMENLRNAFEMRKTADVQGKHLLVVDDVLTTGSTVDECARILKKAGAASIRVITVARS
jgi:competence protein ComFC